MILTTEAYYLSIMDSALSNKCLLDAKYEAATTQGWSSSISMKIPYRSNIQSNDVIKNDVIWYDFMARKFLQTDNLVLRKMLKKL